MRCYDGAPDSELQALIDAALAARRRLAAAGWRAVYFPMEGAYMVFDKDHRPVTPHFYITVLDAAAAVGV